MPYKFGFTKLTQVYFYSYACTQHQCRWNWGCSHVTNQRFCWV